MFLNSSSLVMVYIIYGATSLGQEVLASRSLGRERLAALGYPQSAASFIRSIFSAMISSSMMGWISPDMIAARLYSVRLMR